MTTAQVYVFFCYKYEAGDVTLFMFVSVSLFVYLVCLYLRVFVGMCLNVPVYMARRYFFYVQNDLFFVTF